MSPSLAERREALVERSRSERATILAAADPLVSKAAAADRILTRVRSHPLAVTAIGAAVVLLGSRKLFDIATRLVTVYALFRK
jgi:hypothetical protein